MIKKGIITAVILITVSLFFTACDGDKSRGLYVTFTFDGGKYSWTKGVEGSKLNGETTIVYDGSVTGSVLTTPQNNDVFMTMAFSTAYVVSPDDKSDFPQNGIMLMLGDITGPGVYTYTASSNNQTMIVAINETNYSLDDNGIDSLELEITDIGEIGGYINGSFSATVTCPEDGSQHSITNGKFRVKRIVDHAYILLF